MPPRGEEVPVDVLDASTGEVLRKATKEVSCVNCGVVGHSAGYVQCPKRVEFLGRLNERREEARARGQARSSRLADIRAGVSYAAAIGGRPVGTTSGLRATRPTVTAPSDAGMMADCRDILGGDFLGIFRVLKEFGPSYRRLREEKGRDAAFAALLERFCDD